MSTVLLPWVQQLPWKMQSVLLSGLRGPDTNGGEELKKITRWMRQVTQHNADPNHTYMRAPEAPSIDDAKLWQEIEYSTTWHYFGHLLHALEIIGYSEVRDGTQASTPHRRFATYWYHRLVEHMHLRVELAEVMKERLADKVDHE